MKKKLNTIFKLSAQLLSYLTCEKILMIFNKFVCYFTWYVKKRKFKHVGRGSYVGLHAQIRNPQYITIGDGFFAEDNLRIETYPKYLSYSYNPKMIIKDNVAFGYRCHIGCINKIVIGNNCLFGSNVYITDHFHGEVSKAEIGTIPRERKLFSKGPIIIGKNCWIGDNVCIMPNVSIGDNVIVGANSVVTHNVPSNVVVAGSPAKLIKSLI